MSGFCAHAVNASLAAGKCPLTYRWAGIFVGQKYTRLHRRYHPRSPPLVDGCDLPRCVVSVGVSGAHGRVAELRKSTVSRSEAIHSWKVSHAMSADADQPPVPASLLGGFLRRGDSTAELRSRAATELNRHRWSRTTDRAAATQAARDARLQKFRDAVDPDGVLPPDERERRAIEARRAELVTRLMPVNAARAAAAKARKAK